MRKAKSCLPIFIMVIMLAACTTEPDKKKEDVKTEESVFTAVKGIRYTEVKRRFSNGLSFDTTGFQQEPSWIVEFKSQDTILAYDPGQKIMQGFHLHYDHGNVYNFAKEWFRFKLISKDSLVFQRLQVTKKEIAKDIRSDVNMTFYSDDYLKNVLHQLPEDLQKPSKADTLFIKRRVAIANKYPGDRDSVFAGREVASLKPKSDMITVEHLSSVDPLMGRTKAYDYLYPRYKLIISRAYKDFAYDFNVTVDVNGKMRLSHFFYNIPEYNEVRKKVLEGIVDVYLQNLLLVKPGSTLGIPHASEITVLVTVKKANK